MKYIFYTSHRGLQVVYKNEELKLTADGRIMRLPAKMIEFRNGLYITEDEEEASYLRNCISFRKLFNELDRETLAEDLKAMKQQEEVQGIATSASFVCRVCGKGFGSDRALEVHTHKMHKEEKEEIEF